MGFFSDRKNGLAARQPKLVATIQNAVVIAIDRTTNGVIRTLDYTIGMPMIAVEPAVDQLADYANVKLLAMSVEAARIRERDRSLTAAKMATLLGE